MKEKWIIKKNEVLEKLNLFFDKGEGDRVRILRIVTLLIWINFFGIFILSRAGFFNILNPAKFLFLPPVDSRKEITLFFPGSIEDLHEKSNSPEKTLIVELHQKTEYDDDYQSSGREKRILNNARMILGQLAAAPDNIRGVRVIKDDLLVRNVWFFDGKLIVHLDKKIVMAMNESRQKLVLSCIRKSLQANLGAFTEILVTIQ